MLNPPISGTYIYNFCLSVMYIFIMT
jgi:hypothetical protein